MQLLETNTAVSRPASRLMDEYRSKLITPEQAANLVKSNYIVEYGSHVAKPVDFDQALGARAGDPDLTNVAVRVTATFPPVPTVVTNDLQQKSFLYYNWWYTAVDRKIADMGLCTHIPVNYHEADDMAFGTDYLHLAADVFCIQVAPMDDHGYFNFGLANSHTYAFGTMAKTCIVEVNPNMPSVPGGFHEAFHISEVDYIIEGSENPLFAVPEIPPASETDTAIAKLIVEEISDGACLQLGIGILPNAIGSMIADSDLKDLGVQSELFCDSYVDLYEAGKITNTKKATYPGKSVFTFCIGKQKTYDFLNKNPQAASVPVKYSNDPALIRMNDKVVSINNCLEVDLFTQVCSESKGIRQISGVGGQLDFVDGAFHSKGGKSFLAFNSTYKDKEGKLHSRIRPTLTPGAIVSVPRQSVHYLVTEYGKVNVKCMSIWKRAEAMVNLAHPDFRDELIREAEAMKIWHPTNKLF